MLRTFLAIAVVGVMGLSLATGEEFSAMIKKVDGNKVTFTKAKKGEKGEEMTLPAAKDVKVVKAKFNKEEKKVEAGEALEGGLKNEIFAKDTFARIITDADNKTIIEIRAGGGRKKESK